MKRFEEDKDVISIYMDKLTAQRTCISFIVTRENVVDRPEAANVKLYDYYQQELTISAVSNILIIYAIFHSDVSPNGLFQNYNFAATCSSAGVNEGPEIPNPMPVEPRVKNVTEPAGPAAAPSIGNATIGVILLPIQQISKARHVDGFRNDPEIPENVVRVSSTVTDKPELKTVPPAKVTELVEKLRETLTPKTKDVKSKVNGIEPKLENVSLVDNSNTKINSDGFEEMIPVRNENDNYVREFKKSDQNINDKQVDGRIFIK